MLDFVQDSPSQRVVFAPGAIALGTMLAGFPIPQALRDVGLPRDKIGFVAAEAAKLNITAPRSANVAEIRGILRRRPWSN